MLDSSNHSSLFAFMQTHMVEGSQQREFLFNTNFHRNRKWIYYYKLNDFLFYSFSLSRYVCFTLHIVKIDDFSFFFVCIYKQNHSSWEVQVAMNEMAINTLQWLVYLLPYFRLSLSFLLVSNFDTSVTWGEALISSLIALIRGVK